MLVATAGSQQAGSSGCKILIADDNMAGSWILGRLLSILAASQIELADDGQSALRLMQVWRPDIVLLDIGMPGMNGYQVAQDIRRRPEFDNVLLVAVTGYGQLEDRQRAAEAGFDLHLLKPASVEDLKGVLAHPKVSSRRQEAGPCVAQ